MPTTLTFEAAGLQILGPLAVALLLFQSHRGFRSGYVLRWTLSFAALAVFYLAAVAVHVTSSRPLLQAGTAAVAGAAASIQLGLMLYGIYELASGKTIPFARRKMYLVLLAAAGALAGFLPLLMTSGVAGYDEQLTSVHSLTGLMVFAACGIVIRWYRGSGYLVAASAFAGYGLMHVVPAIRLLLNPSAPMTSVATGWANLIGNGIVALGCVLVILEDQREAALVATSQVEHLAYYDTLTGLPNRALFADRLNVALAQGHRHRYKLAVLFLDVDRFKQINDSLGHTVGDRLLKIVAARIRGAVRDEDTVARFGGDEFTILIHIIGRIEDAGKIAQKILDSLKAPIQIDDREFVVTSSIGISVFPVDGTDGETLIRNADTAMYRAKEVGRNTHHFYAATMNHKALEALEVENGLRRALANNEFILYYQPLVDLSNGAVFGLEALIRWQHPELGLLRPDRFIPAAEQSGLIIGIGRWVLSEACKQAADWHRRGHQITMAVNLSGRQFQDPDLIPYISEALESAGLAPEFLEVEITEGYAMQDVEKAIETLRELKSLGIRIAIDDFGTGYSCLNYLRQFPIDTLKLDGSFLRDVNSTEDAQIALGVIALAHSLNLKVIAEGVETIGQLRFLHDNACDRLQGYLFSRPLPPSKFERFMVQKDLLRFARSH